MAMREADSGPASGANTFSLGDACRHGRTALRQPSFNWNAPDKYIELLTLEIEVAKNFRLRYTS